MIRDGETGLLVPIDDVEALAVAINRVLSDREMAQAMTAAGHDEFLANFSEAVEVQRYLDFFAKVTGQEQGPAA